MCFEIADFKSVRFLHCVEGSQRLVRRSWSYAVGVISNESSIYGAIGQESATDSIPLAFDYWHLRLLPAETMTSVQ